MIRRTLPLLLLSFVILISAPKLSRAVGLDIGPIVAKLTEQLTEMAKQLEEAKKTSTAAQDQINAIGKAGQISLPLINAAKMASQIRQDMQCLKPDLSKLMPSIEFENLDWNSVCQAGSAYRQTLWLDPNKIRELGGWQNLDGLGKEVEQRRENVLSDAAEKGLGLGDVASKEVVRTIKVADELEAEAKAAKTENDRLSVIAESQPVLIRAIAQQNQILAQMLKVQSAFAVKAGLDVQSLMEKEGDKKEEAGQ